MPHRIFCLGNLYGAVAFLCMLLIPAAVEGGMLCTAVSLIIVFAVMGFLAMRENGNG